MNFYIHRKKGACIHKGTITWSKSHLHVHLHVPIYKFCKRPTDTKYIFHFLCISLFLYHCLSETLPIDSKALKRVVCMYSSRQIAFSCLWQIRPKKISDPDVHADKQHPLICYKMFGKKGAAYMPVFVVVPFKKHQAFLLIPTSELLA